MEPILRIENLNKSFGTQQVLKNLDLEIGKGEVMTLLGPSGCGKTTTLHITAGILAADSGNIFLRGTPVTHLPPQKRRVGMVFQRYALFPHMSVFENVAFGLKMNKIPSAEIQRRVHEILDVVRLPDVTDKFPSQLSGGMQQRVAFARALVMEPDILLLDEPFSNLDEKLRREMEVETRRIQQSVNITTLFVTHNQEEAFVMSDWVAVMSGGKIVRMASPKDIYSDPGTRFVCDFLGDANYLEGEVAKVEADHVLIRVGDMSFEAKRAIDVGPGQAVAIAIRPERIDIGREQSKSTHNILRGMVKEIIYKGASLTYYLTAGGREFEVVRHAREDEALNTGDQVFFGFDREAVLVFKREGNDAG